MVMAYCSDHGSVVTYTQIRKLALLFFVLTF